MTVALTARRRYPEMTTRRHAECRSVDEVERFVRGLIAGDGTDHHHQGGAGDAGGGVDQHHQGGGDDARGGTAA